MFQVYTYAAYLFVTRSMWLRELRLSQRYW